MSDKKNEKFRRCLGIDCQEMVKKPEWFCPRCRQRKNDPRKGRVHRANIPGSEKRNQKRASPT